MTKHLTALLALLITLVTLPPAPARAGEGMWLFENLPKERIRRETGVALTDEWLTHVQRASLRMDNGGSASFVGPNGLIITNHHVVRGVMALLTTDERDLLTDGYLARTPSDELRLPQAAVRALWTIEDVTERVKSAGRDLPAEEAEKARRAEIAAIEREAQEATGLECDVVTFYNGGLYHLYSYKRWTDVRLVWAPHGAVGHFGGDVDNFRYPRWSFDAAIVRAYDDDGEPVRPGHFLAFTEDGLEDGQACFVSGHPGSTRRLLSADHLRFLRDEVWPMQLAYTFRRQVELERFADEHPEDRALIRRDLPGIRNWRKALDDRLRALQVDTLFERKRALEAVFRLRTDANPDYAQEIENAYERIVRSVAIERGFFEEHFVINRAALNRSDLFAIARRIVRRADELTKPDDERLPDYTQARMPEVERRIMTEGIIEPALERHRAETWFGLFAETLGAESEIVLNTMRGMIARDRAREVVDGTSLADLAFREKLMAMSPAELARVDDPMIQLARILEAPSRNLIERDLERVTPLRRDAYDTIARARFDIFGAEDYPDATFTLRLSFGRVGGFEDEGGTIPPFTEMGGIFDRHDERGPAYPFDLPKAWLDAKAEVDLDTPMNFITDHHIIGGNSGSPVIDARARFVGVIFDGNRYSASWGSIYEGQRGRAISVDARAIAEGLREVYDAAFLVGQLKGE